MIDILFGGHIQTLQQGFDQPFPVGPGIHVMCHDVSPDSKGCVFT
jgi:hypothetical protein